MQHSNQVLLEIPPAAERVQQVRSVAVFRLQRHRVDREIAPAQVILDAGKFHYRQCTRIWIGFSASRGKIKARDCHIHRRRISGQKPGGSAESGVHRDLSPVRFGKASRQPDRVPFHDEIQVLDRTAKQEIAHYAPCQVDPHTHPIGLG